MQMRTFLVAVFSLSFSAALASAQTTYTAQSGSINIYTNAVTMNFVGGGSAVVSPRFGVQSYPTVGHTIYDYEGGLSYLLPDGTPETLIMNDEMTNTGTGHYLVSGESGDRSVKYHYLLSVQCGSRSCFRSFISGEMIK